MKTLGDLEIERLISKIKVDNVSTIEHLRWLSEGDNNSLEDYSLCILIRHLLNKVAELEKRIDQQQITF